MATMTSMPPGRAGRLWLMRRLESAERGRAQLERKLRILLPEQQRLRLRAARFATEWEHALATAQTWQLRAVVLGGEDALRTATPDDPAVVDVAWVTSMGLAYPDAVTVRTPPAPRSGNAAIGPACSAFRAAVEAGVRAAVAEEALRRVETEVAVTRRRLRALEKRLIPAVEEALRTLELALEQTEQEEHVRLRLAAEGAATPGALP